MNATDITKLPRLYTPHPLQIGVETPLTPDQAHYLRNVLRRENGSMLRLFDGKNGEFLAKMTFNGKKDGAVLPQTHLRPQPATTRTAQILFAPLAKNRMDILIEKAVELGVTDFHPVLTRRTEHRKINENRLHAQIIESSEQCERITIPSLRPLTTLEQKIAHWPADKPIQWCCERDKLVRKPLGALQDLDDQIFLIGPVGGFDENEIRTLSSQKSIIPITLGDDILRAETASILCLAAAKWGRLS